MKLSSMLVASLFTAALAGDALALDTVSGGGYNGALGNRPMPTLGLPLPLGNQGFIDAMTPIGPTPFLGQQACAYIMKWRSPLAIPGGPAQLCVLAEIQTGLNQGCPQAAATNIGTFVASVPGACGGYNAGGTPFPFPGADGVNLILNEAPTGLGVGALSGVVVFPGGVVALAVGPW